MTLLLALTDAERTFWIVLLVAGAVVLVVVALLLQRLYTEVVRIDHGAKGVWDSATRLARNTATSWQLGQTAAALSAIRDEAVRHDELLEERS